MSTVALADAVMKEFLVVEGGISSNYFVLPSPDSSWAAYKAVTNQPYKAVSSEPCQCAMCRTSTPEGLADVKTKALEWVNALRTEWGYPSLRKLPKGRRNSSTDCPMARALPDAMSVYSALKLKSGTVLGLPLSVTSFVAAFDAGMYPELIA